jgi:hypothetical protein
MCTAGPLLFPYPSPRQVATHPLPHRVIDVRPDPQQDPLPPGLAEAAVAVAGGWMGGWVDWWSDWVGGRDCWRMAGRGYDGPCRKP